MHPAFTKQQITGAGADIAVSSGGSGPPLLLLHGHPQTHMMWAKVASRLADRFTIIAADLRGYGASSKPESTADHAPYAKRAMAADMVAVMRELGHEQFFVVGHDRGARVTHRLCLDHPDKVKKAGVLDIAPTRHMYPNTNMDFATGYWHWFFLIQPYPLPEKIIGTDPKGFWMLKCGSGSAGLTPFAPEALEDYLRCYRDPATIHAICEDYRASSTIDLQHDDADFAAGQKVTCPLLVLWGANGQIAEWYDPITVWRHYADDVIGTSIEAGHYLAEEAPDAVTEQFIKFFGD